VLVIRTRAPSIDSRLAPFEVVAPSGGTWRSTDLHGRVTLVNIWASWCGPCREELPQLDSLAARFDTTRVVFAALSDDVDGAAAREFATVVGGLPHLRVGLGTGKLKPLYRYPGLPYTMLVGRDGRIVKRWYGYGGPPQIAAIDSIIRSLDGN
jgi:cytochrome c biogenesis protein CcmG/thiol:disulfide interchange protein DsbE